MNLLQEIQKDVVDPSLTLAPILRKAKILAARLANEPFKQWVEKELNGYRDDEELPAYRIIPEIQIYGDFSGPFGSALKNAGIPSTAFPQKLRSRLKTARMSVGVSFYEDLVRGDSKDNLMAPLPPEARGFLHNNVYIDMQCLAVWQLIPRSAVIAILDTIRNRLLNFVLEIEAEAPAAGESKPGSPPLPQDRVTQVFNTTIWGGNINLSVAGHGITQTLNLDVREGDLEGLKQYLSSLGVSDPDLSDLQKAITEDDTPKSSGNFGKKVSGWIGKMTGKAAAGAWNIGLSTAGALLLKALSKYYGLED